MAAAESFQKDHGLKVDGLVDPSTRAAMNRPPGERVEEIRASLEEQKAFFSEAGDRFVMVNIPDAPSRLIGGR